MAEQADYPFLNATKEGVRLTLRVQPKASRIGPVGVLGESLRWSVTAPAAQGKANKQLIESIAKTFGVSRKQVTLVSGSNSRNKVVEIVGYSTSNAATKLRSLMS